MDVLIVGGGVMGCALACELARDGVSVGVVDRGEVCSGSSGLNAGGVRHQFGSEVNVALAARTIDRLLGFPDEFGVDLGFAQVGYLFMADETAAAPLRAAADLQHRLGVPTRFISPSDIAELVPGIVTDDLVGGSFCPADGHLDPHALVTAFAADARRNGATVRTGTAVTGFERVGDRIAAVVLDGDERVPVGTVVNCAGAWAGQLAKRYGGDLPIVPWRSQVYVLRDTPPLGDRLPMTIDFGNGKTYFHADGPGLIAGMDNETASPVTVDVPFDWAKVGELVEHLVRRLPVLEDARVTGGWAGLLELTPDENPIVGWTHCENVYTAAGFSGHGLSIAPGLAVEVARELTGRGPTLALDAYRPDRFLTGAVAVEALSMR